MYNFLLALRRLTTMKERDSPEACDPLQSAPSPSKRHSRVNMRRRRSSARGRRPSALEEKEARRSAIHHMNIILQ